MKDIVETVNGFLRSLFAEKDGPAGLYRMMGYHLGLLDDEGRELEAPWPARYGGKKLRAALCLHSCSAAGGNPDVAVPAAGAIELVQNFSLVHDDIEDGDRERRHRPTVWVLWGVPQAINTGSSMQALVNAALLRTNAPAETLLDVLGALTDAMVKMTEGQHLDIAFEGLCSVTPEDYRAMAGLKTGALMEAAAYTGARLATSHEQRLAAWRRFGLSFGEAFQARDDLLGVVGDPASTGKPVGNDIRARKKALPLVLAMRDACPADRLALRELLGAEEVTDEAVTAVTAIMERSGALDATRNAVDAATRAALAALDETGAGDEATGELRATVLEAVGRNR